MNAVVPGLAGSLGDLVAALPGDVSGLLHGLPLWFWETDAEHRFVFLSDNWTAITGSDTSEYIGLSRYEMCKTLVADQPYLARHMEHLNAREPFRDFTYRHRFRGGITAWVTSSGDPRHDAAGRFVGYQGAAMVLSATVESAVSTLASRSRLLERAVELERTVAARTDALEHSHWLLSGILESMDQGLLVYEEDVDGSHTILLSNSRFAELLEIPGDLCQPGGALGRVMEHCEARGDFADLAGGQAALRAAADAARPILLTLGRDGRSILYQIVRQSEIGAVVTCTDVTALETRKRELEQARRDADLANAAKSRFLAAMSHEIRTPMNGVIGMAELLIETPLSSEQTMFARTILDSAVALTEVIGDVLDFSKIEAGKMTLSHGALDLAALAEDVRKLLAHRAMQAGVLLQVELGPMLPALWTGDAVRLRQILLNLVGNAIKFTHVGHIRIGVAITEGGGLTIEVEDTGIGIPADRLSTIFDAFEQVDPSDGRRYGGTGLGLEITRRLVELMGGTLSARSTVGLGSVFTARLPPAKIGLAGAPPKGRDTLRPSRDLRGLRVLVAEDNRTNRMVLRHMLAPLGGTVEFCVDGTEAVAAHARGFGDLMLMDMAMPRMSGVNATRQIRRNEATKGLARCPIIALTGNATAQARAECLAAGMDGFLTKPIRKTLLLNEIFRVIAEWPTVFRRGVAGSE